MKFCSRCGSDKVEWRVPDDDNRHRHTCDACGAIFYENPKIVTGCIPVWEDQILLCKRAIEPRLGFWTLPAGFMENGETAPEAAARETWEEAVTQVEIHDLYAVFNLPQINQVYMMFRASMSGLDYSAGAESLECGLYREEEIPWSDLAFPTITHTLKYYFEDRATGVFNMRCADIVREDDQAVLVSRRSIPDAVT